MKIVTIQRSKWQRGGNDPGPTCLWDRRYESGCCLGHILHQAHKVSYVAMNRIYTPGNLAYKIGKKNPLTISTTEAGLAPFSDSILSDKAMAINDNMIISDKMREYRLKLLFKRHGYELKFVE